MLQHHLLVEQHLAALHTEAQQQRQARLARGTHTPFIYQIVPVTAGIERLRQRIVHFRRAAKGMNGSEWFYRQRVDSRKNRIDAEYRKTVS